MFVSPKDGKRMPAANAGAGTRVNSVSPDEVADVQEGCQTVVECAVGEALTTDLLWLVFVVGVLVPVAVLAFARLRDALAVLREERTEASGEVEAYGAFARRIARMDPDRVPTPTAAGGSTVGAAGIAHRGGLASDASDDAGLEEVFEAYRDTIMAEGGRAAATDRAVVEDMAAEFGSDLAGTVARSDRLSPQLRSALIRGAREAATRREELVAAVDREVDHLTDARATLERIDGRVTEEARGPFDNYAHENLIATWETVDELEGHCESLLESRQDRIHAEQFNRGSDPGEVPPLQSYLYDSLDVTFPVLAEGVDLAGRVRTVRSRVESALASR